MGGRGGAGQEPIGNRPCATGGQIGGLNPFPISPPPRRRPNPPAAKHRRVAAAAASGPRRGGRQSRQRKETAEAADDFMGQIRVESRR